MALEFSKYTRIQLNILVIRVKLHNTAWKICIGSYYYTKFSSYFFFILELDCRPLRFDVAKITFSGSLRRIPSGGWLHLGTGKVWPLYNKMLRRGSLSVQPGGLSPSSPGRHGALHTAREGPAEFFH